MRKAGDIVADLFNERFGSGFMKTARANAGLFSSWKRIVAEVWPAYTADDTGKRNEDIPAAAVHSQIRELEKGILLVEADHPGWIQILQTKQRELLSVIQRWYPELTIRGIAFRLGRTPMPDAVMEEQPPQTVNVKQEVRDFDIYKNRVAPSEKTSPRDGEFYAALKGLEESIKIRNGL